MVFGYYLFGGDDFVSNILPYSTPRGTDVRVFSAKALSDIAATSNDPADREHVSLHFWEHPEKYTRRNVSTQLPDYATNLRLTVDTEDDFKLVNAIYDALYPANPAFTLSDVIELLRLRSDLRAMNAHVQQKSVR